MITTDALIQNARSFVGVPFLHQGRSRHGVDCLGFIASCAAELGSSILLDNLPRAYGRNPQKQLVQGLVKLTRNIRLQPAAIIVFQFPNATEPSHAAIYTGTSIIHSYQSVGKVVEHSFSAAWPKMARSYWAMPLVQYA